jgi:L-aspartate oxidase
MQFHPTAFYTPEEQGSKFLISEAVRGFGGILKTRDGKTFMERYHPDRSLATRDIVARAIDHELKLRGDSYVLLDITHLPARRVRERFPNIYRRCLEYNVDITKQPIPVTPAAHYMCGGVSTDLHGRTTLRNLYACGEVAHTGLHGANRLASNSLLEAVVFAKRAFVSAAQQLNLGRPSLPVVPRWDDKGTRSSREWVLISHNKREIRAIMWDYVGIVRSRQRLLRAQKRLDLVAREMREYYRKTKITNDLLELRNMVTMAQLIVVCALKRQESRGLHFITDFPRRNDRRWKKDTLIRKTRHAD